MIRRGKSLHEARAGMLEYAHHIQCQGGDRRDVQRPGLVTMMTTIVHDEYKELFHTLYTSTPFLSPTAPG